jgi:hypothetical protein
MRCLLVVLWLVGLAGACGGNGGSDTPQPSRPHVIEIDIDDHGLAGLWMANAPNLKGLIARGTLAYSRVLVPTHSNQNNFALLSGQYPEGHSVPSNAWLSRSQNFMPPLLLANLGLGDYADYAINPLLARGDSVYQAVRRAGGRSAYFGQLPPFDAGADEVHLPVLGASFGSTTITLNFARGILTDILHYPKTVVDGYHVDGPPPTGQTYLQFTMRDAAQFVRATSAASPLPDFMFIWDFIAVDGDPTATYGATGDAIVKIVEDYDAGLGELLSALKDKNLLDDTNILFTLDHGKVDTHNQVALGTRGQTTTAAGATMDADGQLGALIGGSQGAALGISTKDYAVLNEDGDALIYARVDGAGTPAGADRQREVTHALLSVIQSGAVTGLDVTRTMTADGAMGTRTFHQFRASGPNQADILVYPIDDWTLNQVDTINTAPGPFLEHTQFAFGRHGGFAADELYVPLIMAGPAFKKGALIPHPVEHPDVPATAMVAIPGARLATAARGPIRAALAGDASEVMAQPGDMAGFASSRVAVLDASGYGARPALAGAAAQDAVIIDVAGLYEEEVFSDDALADAAMPLRTLAATGTRFSDVWARSRDWPVNEYQMMTGSYPTDPFVPAAEDDPTQVVAPGPGLLQMPPVAGFIANRAAYDAWRQPALFPDQSLFATIGGQAIATSLIGEPDFHTAHVSTIGIDSVLGTPTAGVAAGLRDFRAQHARSVTLVVIGHPRTGDRHDPAAKAELAALAAAVTDIVHETGSGTLVAITSRGATPIDDPAADFYGAGTSRHLPLVLIGPNVRAGVVSGQPASPADVPATIMFGLGFDALTDVSGGTRPRGAATEKADGHVLVRGFTLAP